MTPIITMTRIPELTVGRNGTITVSARAVKAMSLEKGDAINIAEENGEYYLYCIPCASCAGKHIARCYPTKGNSHHYRAHSIKLANTFLDILHIQKRKVSFPLGEPVEIGGRVYMPVITKMEI